jgi:hypothetical protein
MKLAACYTVFNGLELLENSINQIKNHVDEIIICYQETSNKGNKCDKVRNFVMDFARNFTKKNIHIVYFKPILSETTKENERMKHQKMLAAARILGCTHFFMAATDHFYVENEFVFGKNTCQIHDYDVTFTKMFTYYKHPTWQLMPIESYYMPFIMKISNNTSIKKMPSYPVIVDPSVQINTIDSFYIFEENDLMLHHYSMIRENINDKFKNAAASIRWTYGMAEKFEQEYNSYNIDENPGIEYFQGRRIKIVPDYFKLTHKKNPV